MFAVPYPRSLRRGLRMDRTFRDPILSRPGCRSPLDPMPLMNTVRALTKKLNAGAARRDPAPPTALSQAGYPPAPAGLAAGHPELAPHESLRPARLNRPLARL